MSADKDRGIRRQKQKRAKQSKTQRKLQHQPADTAREATAAQKKPA